MKARPFDPLHLDVEAFARAGGHLEGSWTLAALPRLMQGAHVEAQSPPAAEVTWSAQGRTIERTGAPAQIWIDLKAQATVALQCQHCLGLVASPLRLERSFRFMPDENQAAELDAESDDEVLVLSRNFDLRELVEDELILALPLVPRHEDCPAPLAAPTDPDALEPEEPDRRKNPFAALAVLKRDRNT
jgi:uncharacterized protein